MNTRPVGFPLILGSRPTSFANPPTKNDFSWSGESHIHTQPGLPVRSPMTGPSNGSASRSSDEQREAEIRNSRGPLSDPVSNLSRIAAFLGAGTQPETRVKTAAGPALNPLISAASTTSVERKMSDQGRYADARWNFSSPLANPFSCGSKTRGR